MTEYLRDLPRKRIGGGVVIVDEDWRILLVEPTYKESWEVPGGMVEVGESPREAARRECREELGFDVEIKQLLVIDWVSQATTAGDGLMFLYATDPIDPSQIALPPEELRSWQWCDREGILDRVQDFKARRLFAALDSIRNGTFLELENGYVTRRS